MDRTLACDDEDLELGRSAGTTLPSWGTPRAEPVTVAPTGPTAPTVEPRTDEWLTAPETIAEPAAVAAPSSAPPTTRPSLPPKRRRPLFLIVPVMLLSTAAVIYVLGRTSGSRPSGQPTTTVSSTVTSSAAPSSTITVRVSTSPASSALVVTSSTSVPTTTTATPTTTATTAASTTTTSATVADPATTATAAVAGSGTAADPSAPRSAIYRGGKVYLQGVVPSQAVADEVIAKAGAVVGPANVVSEYQIVPGTPRDSASPLRIADTVLFDPESSVIRPEFRSLLDLGVVLLNQTPQITIVVTGHTDSQGGVNANMLLAQRRLDAVIAYFTSKGIAANRLQGVAKGQAEPIADNATVAGRRLNRRIEFVVEHILG